MPQFNIKPHPDTDYPNPDDQLGRMEWSVLGFNFKVSTVLIAVIFGRPEKWGGYR
jgi:hypothetical protein